MSYAGLEKLLRAANDPLAAYRLDREVRDASFHLGIFVGVMIGLAVASFGLVILSHFVTITISTVSR